MPGDRERTWEHPWHGVGYRELFPDLRDRFLAALAAPE